MILLRIPELPCLPDLPILVVSLTGLWHLGQIRCLAVVSRVKSLPQLGHLILRFKRASVVMGLVHVN